MTKRSKDSLHKDTGLSQAEMVLTSLYRVSKGTTDKIAYEELVLQAWKDFPEVYSLRNHPEYPDASDIHKKLYQSLKSDGLIVALGNKFFRLTEKGIVRSEQITNRQNGNKGDKSPAKTRLSREEEAFVHHAFNTRAFSAWKESRSSDLVDYDARLFFQFGANTPPEERKKRVDSARQAIRKAKAIGVNDADFLESLADYLFSNYKELFEGRRTA